MIKFFEAFLWSFFVFFIQSNIVFESKTNYFVIKK